MRTRRRLLIVGAILGGLSMLSPWVGLFGTFLGMHRAFSTLGSSGISDPRALSQSIGLTLYSTAAGAGLFLVGAVLLTLSLILLSNVRRHGPPPLPPSVP